MRAPPAAVGAAVAAILAAAPAQGQDFPSVPTPLTIESDHNGVNLTTGQMAMDMPVLAAPAAPNLRFDRVQNAAPYVDGIGRGIGTSGDPAVDYSIHLGSGTSEAFRCDGICESRTRSGSTFIGNVYVQAGSGARWTFRNKSFDNIQTAPIGGRSRRYVENVFYPNGEVIHYEYDTASGPGIGQTWFRPKRISSSFGYAITIDYLGGDLANGNWGSVRQAALYQTGATPVLIRRLVYTGTTITDYGDNPADVGGRVFGCTGCGNAGGSPVETASGTQRLPGETADVLQVIPSTQAGVSQGRAIVGSVVRDGVAWNYSYANLRLDALTNAYWYDSVTVTGPDNFSQLYTMNISDRRPVLARVRDSIQRTTRYDLDEAYRPFRITQPEGNKVAVAYGDNGAVTSRTTTSKSGETVTETVFYATPCGLDATAPCYRPTWSKDGLGRQTDYAYNARGQLTEQTDPADQNGLRRKTYITYDESSGVSRRSVVRQCLFGSTCGTSQETRTEYLYWGNTLLPSRERRIDSYFGRTRDTLFTYDPAGRLLSTDGPLPGTADATYSRYDSFGRKSWEIGALSNEGLRIATRFTYRDSDDKPLYSETGTLPDPDSSALAVFSRSDFAYDDRRNPTRAAVSASGTIHKVTDQSWDQSGRLICTAVRMNPGAFGQTPGACAFTTQGDQGPDRITRNEYDPAGQLTKVQRAYGVTVANGFPATLQQDYARYEYTLNGKRKAVTDANGNRAEMTYDGFDRQRRWIFPSTGAPGKPPLGQADPGDHEEYLYDLVGNRISLRKRDGSVIAYHYDDLNRVIRKIVPERAGLTAAQTRDVYYDYNNALGLQTKARFDNLDGEGVTNYYDAFGQPTTILQAMGGHYRYVSYYHDDAGNLFRLTHPDGAHFYRYHDALGRMTQLLDGPASSIDDYVVRYWYKPEGPRHAAVRGAGLAGFTSVFYYDALQRPVALYSPYVNIGLSYNPASQITERGIGNDSYAAPAVAAHSLAYQVNGLNQYTQASNRTYVYDPNGNLISDGTTSYVYDVENRLVSASGATNASLVYDPLGRLFQTSSPTGPTTQFLYDGDKMIAEYNAAGTLLKRYVHGPGADEPVAEYDGPALGVAGRRYTLPDERGSVIGLINADGSSYWANRYDSWGTPGVNKGRFQYTGQAWIPELQMYHYKARIYSPILGRFLQTDPIGYEDQMNLYAYVGNDPMNGRDPSGECDTGSRLGESAQCRVHEGYQESKTSASGDPRGLQIAQWRNTRSGAWPPRIGPGGLRYHEGQTWNGHTLRTHTGRSLQQLRTRLSRDPALREASTFTDAPMANAALRQAVRNNDARLRGWLQSGHGERFTLIFRAPIPLGMVLARGARDPVNGFGATFILQRNNDPFMQADFVVISGWVTQ